MLRGKTHSQWLAFLWCVSLTNTDLVPVLVLAHTNHVAPGQLNLPDLPFVSHHSCYIVTGW